MSGRSKACSEEAEHIRWVSLGELRALPEKPEDFFFTDVLPLRKYLRLHEREG